MPEIIELLQLSLLSIAAISALLAVELKEIMHAIISFLVLTVTVGIIFAILKAPLVALFQIMVYAGGVVVLFVIAIMLTVRRE